MGGRKRPDAASDEDARSWTRGNDGFDFLGYHFQGGKHWPRKKSLAEAQGHDPRPRHERTSGQSLPCIIADVNRTLARLVRVLPAQQLPHDLPRSRRLDAHASAEHPPQTQQAPRAWPRQRIISRWPNAFFAEHGLLQSGQRPMPRPVNPHGGKTINRRAGCGKSARPVRREGRPKPIGLPYPYQRLCVSTLSALAAC